MRRWYQRYIPALPGAALVFPSASRKCDTVCRSRLFHVVTFARLNSVVTRLLWVVWAGNYSALPGSPRLELGTAPGLPRRILANSVSNLGILVTESVHRMRTLRQW